MQTLANEVSAPVALTSGCRQAKDTFLQALALRDAFAGGLPVFALTLLAGPGEEQ